ncbi:MAG: NusG domain II-containing protein [Clostridia bacterium]|nr:NusG domain II-containing protein [Clostridia bacterium]
MKNFSFDEIKKLKPFMVKDVFLYLILVIIVLTLFVFIVFLPKTTSNGIKIEKNNNVVLTYYFKNSNCIINKDHQNLILVENTEDLVKITIYEDKTLTGFNVVEINLANKSFKVTESNCSLSKECVHTPTATNGNGVIICAPRNLKISFITSTNNGIVTG